MPEEDPKAPLTPLNYKDDPEFLAWLKSELAKEQPDPPKDPSPTGSAGAPVPTSGGGVTVASNQAQDKMGEIVKGLAAGMAEGAVRAAGNSSAPTPVQQVAKKVHAFWGYDVD